MLTHFDRLKVKFSKVQCEHVNNEDADFPHSNLETVSNKPLVKCAILILLFRKKNHFYLTFTVRSERLKSFPGEICFPG